MEKRESGGRPFTKVTNQVRQGAGSGHFWAGSALEWKMSCVESSAYLID
jgi:hypothetical protein